MKYNFEIVHMARIDYESADALFRFPTNGSDSTLPKDDIPIIAVRR